MDKTKAIDIIKQLANIYRGTLQEHQIVHQAVTFIEANLKEPPEQKSTKEQPKKAQ